MPTFNIYNTNLPPLTKPANCDTVLSPFTEITYNIEATVFKFFAAWLLFLASPASAQDNTPVFTPIEKIGVYMTGGGLIMIVGSSFFYDAAANSQTKLENPSGFANEDAFLKERDRYARRRTTAYATLGTGIGTYVAGAAIVLIAASTEHENSDVSEITIRDNRKIVLAPSVSLDHRVTTFGLSGRF